MTFFFEEMGFAFFCDFIKRKENLHGDNRKNNFMH